LSCKPSPHPPQNPYKQLRPAFLDKAHALISPSSLHSLAMALVLDEMPPPPPPFHNPLNHLCRVVPPPHVLPPILNQGVSTCVEPAPGVLSHSETYFPPRTTRFFPSSPCKRFRRRPPSVSFNARRPIVKSQGGPQVLTSAPDLRPLFARHLVRPDGEAAHSATKFILFSLRFPCRAPPLPGANFLFPLFHSPHTGGF